MELMEDGTTIEQQMFAMAAEKKVPLYGVLELLPLCNLNCDMCYVRMSREEMEEVGRLRTMEEWTKTAEDMMKAGTLFVLLTGGEPLLYPHSPLQDFHSLSHQCSSPAKAGFHSPLYQILPDSGTVVHTSHYLHHIA